MWEGGQVGKDIHFLSVMMFSIELYFRMGAAIGKICISGKRQGVTWGSVELSCLMYLMSLSCVSLC